MSVLSRPTVRRLMEQGQIAIRPFRPEYLAPDGSYTFTLADTFLYPAYGRKVSAADPIGAVYTELPLANKSGSGEFYLVPGGFILLRTAERLNTASRLVCWLSTHPSLAKLGLDLLQSSCLVPSGCDCCLTLETSNRGSFLVKLSPGQKAVKAVFLRTD